jgi:RHS repeat-associated protein
LKQANEKPQGWTDANCASDPTKCWKQTFTFDRYGNRRFDEGNTTTPASFTDQAVTNPTISPANNRLTSSGYAYDAAGNTTRDAQDRKFTYDAENKQVKVESLSPGTDTVVGTVGEYFYDGDGKRVKKHAPSTSETTLFVYDAFGKLVSENSTIVASSNEAKVGYLTNDQVSSPRINTDANGRITARHDYRPFGEEIASSDRANEIGYRDDAIRNQFTGYQSDTEAGLENAGARTYASVYGRFTTTDPSRESIDLKTPQSWNRYSYCYNSPLTFIDKNGKWPTWVHNHLIDLAFSGLTKAERKIIKDGSESTDRRRDKAPYFIATRNPANASEHSMREEGVSNEDGLDKTDGFVRGKLTDAQKSQLSREEVGLEGLSEKALYIFGQGSHALEDYSSPEHGPNGVYSIPRNSDGSINALKWHAQEVFHFYKENYMPNSKEAMPSLVRMRAAFLVAFGEKAFQRAVRNRKDREQAKSFLKSIGYAE